MSVPGATLTTLGHTHTHTAPGIAGIEPQSGRSRWLGPGRRGVYHLADRDETAWAELYRALAESRREPTGAMPRDLHRVEVSLDHVADLSTERSRRELGLPRMRATQTQWPAFQAVGERLAADGAQAILYRSAARTRAFACAFLKPSFPD